MTDNIIKKMLIKFSGFSLGPILGGLLMSVTIPITTYFLTPTEYGKASMFTAIQGFIATIAYFGFDQAFSREFNEIHDKQKLFMNSIILPFFSL